MAHLRVRLHVDVHVAHAVGVAQHWDACVALDVADQLVRAAVGRDGTKNTDEESSTDPPCHSTCWMRWGHRTARWNRIVLGAASAHPAAASAGPAACRCLDCSGVHPIQKSVRSWMRQWLRLYVSESVDVAWALTVVVSHSLVSGPGCV